jgi:hypothetical protein
MDCAGCSQCSRDGAARLDFEKWFHEPRGLLALLALLAHFLKKNRRSPSPGHIACKPCPSGFGQKTGLRALRALKGAQFPPQNTPQRQRRPVCVQPNQKCCNGNSEAARCT